LRGFLFAAAAPSDRKHTLTDFLRYATFFIQYWIFSPSFVRKIVTPAKAGAGIHISLRAYLNNGSLLSVMLNGVKHLGRDQRYPARILRFTAFRSE